MSKLSKQKNLKENENKGDITGVKLAHELMVDIIGGLIPGVLFIFSIIMCVVFPFFCYSGIPNFPTDKGDTSGWFWVVVFLTFLILAYVVGHIFYRSDIKMPDQKDLKKRMKKFFKKELKKDINELISEKRNSNEEHNSETKRNRTNCIFKRFRLQNENEIISGYFIDMLRSEIQPLRRHLKCYIQNTQKERIDKVYGKKYVASCDNIINQLDSSGNTWELHFQKYNSDILIVLFPELIEEYKESIKYENLPKSTKDILSYYEKEIEKYLKRLYRNDQDRSLLRLTVCYCILHFQNESACSTGSRCDFPYIAYYKYLLKRNETELLKYVDWHTNEKRTKNKINKYKIKLQMFAPSSYSILNKNESHVRMASSTWHVASTMMPIVIIMCFFTLIPVAANVILYYLDVVCKLPAQQCVYRDMLTHLRFGTCMLISCVACLFPLSIFILLRYIKCSIVKFIHYQRLREIFHTLYTYNQWENKSKADNGNNDNITE